MRAARIEARCGPTSIDLGLLSLSVFGYPGRRRWTVRCAVHMYGTSGWIKSPCRLDHFAPHHQEVVKTEVEDAFRGVSMAESCCSQGQALAPGTVQLDRVVGRICFGLQRPVFWVKKHLITGADSLYRNLDVSSLNGQWLLA